MIASAQLMYLQTREEMAALARLIAEQRNRKDTGHREVIRALEMVRIPLMAPIQLALELVGSATGREFWESTVHAACRNCGVAVTGAHCSACGQRVHLHRSLLCLGHDLLHGLLMAITAVLSIFVSRLFIIGLLS